MLLTILKIYSLYLMYLFANSCINIFVIDLSLAKCIEIVHDVSFDFDSLSDTTPVKLSRDWSVRIAPIFLSIMDYRKPDCAFVRKTAVF